MPGENGVLVRFRCINLLVADDVGRPGATRCGIHAQRTFGMPITMIAENGSAAFQSRCISTYPRPQDAVPPECSYQFVPDALIQIRPQYSILYAPRL